MSQSDARFHIELNTGTFDVSGSEEFVREQMQQHGEVIQALLDKLRQSPAGTLRPPTAQTPETEALGDTRPAASEGNSAIGTGSDASEVYPNVFSISEGEIRIISDLPGKGNAEQSVNVALLYLLAKESLGAKRATFKEIQEVCKTHACLDTPNFAKVIRAAKKELNVYGSRGSMEAELTHPGRRVAQTLAQQLNAD
jgi:hypothetical protein